MEPPRQQEEGPHAFLLEERGDNPSERLFAWCVGLLRRHVRERNRSPRFLGIDGDKWDADSRSELTHEFFMHVWKELPKLQMRVREGLLDGGYLGRMAKNFVTDRRRAADPLGNAGYRRLRHSIELQVAAGRVAPPQDSPKALGKESVLRLAAVKLGRAATLEDLRAALRRYPERERLARTFAKKGHRETAALAGLWPHLERERVASFRLGDLLILLVEQPRMLDGFDEDAHATFDVRSDDVLQLALRRIERSGLPVARQAQLGILLQACAESSQSAAPVNIAEIGRGSGLDRRRMHELMQQLRSILGPLLQELEIQPDNASDRPSRPP